MSELAKVAVVELRSDPKLIGDASGHIEPEIRKGGAALTGVHGQPIIGVRVDKSLRCESVHFHFAVKESEVLRLYRELARTETGKDQSDNSSIHTASLVIC